MDADGIGWHNSGNAVSAGTSINLSTGSHTGDPEVFGLDTLRSESITLAQAEPLAWLLLGYVAAARDGEAAA